MVSSKTLPQRPPPQKSRTQRFLQSSKRYLCYVIGYNWLVALTVLPFALTVVLLLALLHIPVAVVAVVAYIFFELTAFCLERNWSRVSYCRFWGNAAPLIVVNALLCLLLSHKSALGCLIFSALCLGVRETLLQLQYSSPNVGGYDAKERITVALTGGFAYCTTIALLCSSAYSLVRITQYKLKVLDPIMMEVVFIGVLPLLRFLSRLFCTQVASSAALAPEPLGPVPEGIVDPLVGGDSAPRPQLDTLVMYTDVAWAFTMFLEVAFTFTFLLIPHTISFAVAVSINVLLDVLFVCVLDTLQKRRLRASPAPTKTVEEVGLSEWSPTYCIERPRSMISTIMSGSLSRWPSEATPLSQGASSGQASQARAGRAAWGGRAGDRISSPRAAAVQGKLRECWSRCREGCDGCDCCGPRASEPLADESGAMSPRVSYLMDEYNDAVIQCMARPRSRKSGSSGSMAVYLYQERKLTFSTHLLGNTVALALAASCVPILLASGDLRFHTFQWTELVLRIVALLVLRCFADYLACWCLEYTSTEVHPDMRALLWETGYEMSTCHGWTYRVLMAVCPLFAVIAATFP